MCQTHQQWRCAAVHMHLCVCLCVFESAGQFRISCMSRAACKQQALSQATAEPSCPAAQSQPAAAGLDKASKQLDEAKEGLLKGAQDVRAASEQLHAPGSAGTAGVPGELMSLTPIHVLLCSTWRIASCVRAAARSRCARCAAHNASRCGAKKSWHSRRRCTACHRAPAAVRLGSPPHICATQA